jgi:hypothetical protein
MFFKQKRSDWLVSYEGGHYPSMVVANVRGNIEAVTYYMDVTAKLHGLGPSHCWRVYYEELRGAYGN